MKRQCVQPHIFIKSDMKRHSEDGPRGARGVFVFSGMTGEDSLGLPGLFCMLHMLRDPERIYVSPNETQCSRMN